MITTIPWNSMWHAKRKRVRELLEAGHGPHAIMARLPVKMKLIERVQREMAAQSNSELRPSAEGVPARVPASSCSSPNSPTVCLSQRPPSALFNGA